MDPNQTPPGADWRAALPDDLKEHASIKDYKDVTSVAKALIETKAFVGSSIRPPSADASPEARSEFVQKLQKHAPELVLLPNDPKQRAEVEAHIMGALGQPKDATGYKLDGFKAGEPLSDDEVKALRERASKRGWTQKQFAGEYEELALAKSAALESRKSEIAALRRDWGAAYDERMSKAAAAAEKLGVPPEDVKALRSGQVRADQAKLWYGIAAALGSEANPVAGQAGLGAGKPTPDEIRALRAELRGRKEFWDRSINSAVSDALRKKDLELAEQLDQVG